MERTFFEDYATRFQLDARLVQMRHDFELFKESLRRTLIARYKVKPPSPKSAQP